MGRKIAMLWHACCFPSLPASSTSFSCCPAGTELMGETSHTLGTALRIVAGALIGLAALPVVFTLLRTRKPELGTPQLALSLRTWSIVAHVLAGVLIIGTAISEIWLSLDAAGQYLFAIYGGRRRDRGPRDFRVLPVVCRRAAAATAETDQGEETQTTSRCPPQEGRRAPKTWQTTRRSRTRRKRPPKSLKQPPKPKRPKTPQKLRRAEVGETVEATPDEPEADRPKSSRPTHRRRRRGAPGGLQNRRPTGKASHRIRRRSTRGGVALDEPRPE